MQKKFMLIICGLATSLITMAQTVTEQLPPGYDPNTYKIIPDKVFEIGLPVLLIFLLANAVVTILKNRAEHQLKMKMIDKGLSEETLTGIFRESNMMARFQPLKWFLFSLALAIAFLIIHACRAYLINQSGYLAVAIVLLCMSAAFLIYYRILSAKI